MWAAVLAVLGARVPAAPAADTPVAVHGMVYLDAPESFQRAMFEAARAAGASVLRVDLQLSAVVTATPWWMADCPTSAAAAESWKCPPRDLAAWAALVAAAAARGRGVLGGVEVLNEPDGPWAFSGDAARYGQMLAAAGGALHAAVPGVPVLNGGLMTTASAAWMETALAQPGALDAIDVVHVRGTWLGAVLQVAAWKTWFAARGLDRPLWVTEFGYPADPAFQDDPAYADGEAGQARYLADTLPELVRAGAARVFVTLRDNLTGEYASEGVVGGTVADPPVAAPAVRGKPALMALRGLVATWPAWPAALPAPAPVPVAVPPASPAPAPVAAPAPPPPSLSVGPGRSLRAALRDGVPVTVVCPARCAPTARGEVSRAEARAARLPSRTVASAGHRAAHTRHTLRLRFTAPARRALARSRRVSLTVRVAGVGSAALRLRR